MQSPLEKEREIIQEIEEVSVSLVSLNQTGQEVELSLNQQNNPSLVVSRLLFWQSPSHIRCRKQ
jgi:hypothetical protein